MGDSRVQRMNIDELVNGLVQISDFTSKPVNTFLKSHPVNPDSINPYIFFSPGCYTRNLIFKNDVFELLALCWEVGQVSTIHNHRDQQCWMMVPIGTLKNQNFRVFDRNAEKATCRLESTNSVLITPDSPLEVNPDEPVHQIMNLSEYARRAVSLHIYSRPFNICEVYSTEFGTYRDVPLYYTSEYGKLTEGETATPGL